MSPSARSAVTSALPVKSFKKNVKKKKSLKRAAIPELTGEQSNLFFFFPSLQVGHQTRRTNNCGLDWRRARKAAGGGALMGEIRVPLKEEDETNSGERGRKKIKNQDGD